MARLQAGLGRAREGLLGRLAAVVTGHAYLDPDLLEEIEGVLLGADMGPEQTEWLMERLKVAVGERRVAIKDVPAVLEEQVRLALVGASRELVRAATPPTVVLLVGVNGTGKTTTAGKLAARLIGQGQRVLLGAGDTFRAAAVDQLELWAQRTGADVVAHTPGGDPAAVIFDAVSAGVARRCDYVICDTAGRLHTKTNLMAELRKIAAVAGRAHPGAPHEVVLVLDASTGQNGLQQAKVFGQSVPLTGIVLTKLDGTARGGIVLAVHRTFALPILFTGVGEAAEDLVPFDPAAFAAGLLRATP